MDKLLFILIILSFIYSYIYIFALFCFHFGSQLAKI